MTFFLLGIHVWLNLLARQSLWDLQLRWSHLSFPGAQGKGGLYHSAPPVLFLFLHVLISMERGGDLGQFSQVSALALELWAQT